MEKDEAKKRFLKHMGEREPVFKWREVPDTHFWFDYDANSLNCDLDITINCENYSKIWDCMWDLFDSIVEHYNKMGIEIHEAY